MAKQPPAHPTEYGKETGFGNRIAEANVRLVKPDGSANVIRRGLPFWRPSDFYHNLITMSWPAFIGLILVVFALSNLLFASLYIVVDVSEFRGMANRHDFPIFWQYFFFSAQTITTVGYGGISPAGHLASAISTLEALFGWLMFAIITGLLYGRFSRPQARLIYSNNAIIAPFKEANAFMFRVANAHSSQLIDVKVELVYSRVETDKDGPRRHFYQMKTEVARVNFLTLSWTVVHPITEDSPMWGIDEATMSAQQSEILILITAYEDTFAQTVHNRKSYVANEVVWGARFPRMFHTDHEGKTVLDLDQIHNHEPAALIELQEA